MTQTSPRVNRRVCQQHSPLRSLLASRHANRQANRHSLQGSQLVSLVVSPLGSLLDSLQRSLQGSLRVNRQCIPHRSRQVSRLDGRLGSLPDNQVASLLVRQDNRPLYLRYNRLVSRQLNQVHNLLGNQVEILAKLHLHLHQAANPVEVQQILRRHLHQPLRVVQQNQARYLRHYQPGTREISHLLCSILSMSSKL